MYSIGFVLNIYKKELAQLIYTSMFLQPRYNHDEKEPLNSENQQK